MWEMMAFNTLKAAYQNGGRAILAKAVSDPEVLWDDLMLGALDAVLGYEEGSDGEKQD